MQYTSNNVERVPSQDNENTVSDMNEARDFANL
jgi:hypothetical protein